MIRAALKRIAERTLRALPVSPERRRGRALILAYHNVVPDSLAGRGDSSLHLPMQSFLRQLDLLEEYCEVAPLDEILGGRRSSDGSLIAITFDDAYRGAVELALPELHRRNLPATLFVAPGLLSAESFWWDVMAESGGGLTDSIRHRLLTDDEGRGDQILARLPVRAAPSLPAYFGCATEHQIRALDSFPGLTLGAHSWTHPNLARLHGRALERELEDPLNWLNSTGSRFTRALAYPYGIASPETADAARKAGYHGALRVEGGWIPRELERWQVPRLNIPAGLSEDGFVLRILGML